MWLLKDIKMYKLRMTHFSFLFFFNVLWYHIDVIQVTDFPTTGMLVSFRGHK
jgi:hypothetical protein